MANGYYEHTVFPAVKAKGASAPMRAELAKIAAGFDLIVELVGNGGKLVAISEDGTRQVALDGAELAELLGVLLKAGGTMEGPLILAGPPTEDLHAANKQYVDEKTFDLHDDVANELTAGQLHNDDRIVLSDVSAPGDPNVFSKLSTLKTYVNS